MKQLFLLTTALFFLFLPLNFCEDELLEQENQDDSIVTTKQGNKEIIPLDKKDMVYLTLQGADVATVMKGISQLGHYDYVTKGEIEKTVNLALTGRSIREALDIISDSTNTEYRVEGTIITVYGEGVDPAFTKTYTVLRGNTQTIGQVLKDLIGATITTQSAASGQGGQQGGGGGGAPKKVEKGSARIVVDKLNSQIIVTAVPSDHRKIEKVWDVVDVDRPKKRFQTKMFELKFIGPDTFVKSIKFLIPGIEETQIFSFAESGGGGENLSSSQKRVIIQETPANLNRIQELLEEIDVPPRQVVIDLKMVEFTLNNDQKLGVDWKSIFTQSGRSLPVAEFFSPLSSQGTGRLKFGSLGPDHLQMVLDFIKAHSEAKILSNPQLTVVDGETANLKVGDQIPYRTTVVNQGVAVGQVQFANAGVELEVTPVIFKDDFVNLTLKPAITSRTGDFDGIPIISTKETETVLNIRNNHTVVMGGLISHSDSDERNQIPIVGQIPGLGKLFSNSSRNVRANELVFFITPKIYSEFAAHPHKSLKYEFRQGDYPAPGPYHFVDHKKQRKEFDEFVKRSKL